MKEYDFTLFLFVSFVSVHFSYCKITDTEGEFSFKFFFFFVVCFFMVDRQALRQQNLSKKWQRSSWFRRIWIILSFVGMMFLMILPTVLYRRIYGKKKNTPLTKIDENIWIV
jgi:hypothetical protein